jgi:hypothetical protein
MMTTFFGGKILEFFTWNNLLLAINAPTNVQCTQFIFLQLPNDEAIINT